MGRSECRDLEDVKKELRDSFDGLKFERDLWEKVEIKYDENDAYEPVTQDCLVNATLIRGIDNKGRERPLLQVSGYNPYSEHEETYELPIYYLDEDGDAYVSNRMEAFNDVRTRLLNISPLIWEYETQYEKCEEVYVEFIDNILAAFKRLNENCLDFKPDGYPCQLEHLLLDVVINQGTNLLVHFDVRDEWD